MTERITSAPQSKNYIHTLEPISDTDLMAEVAWVLKPTEQISCARITNRTKTNPKGKWEHYGWPIDGDNPFDQFEHEVESFFCTGIVEKGSTTRFKRGEPVGIFGIMLDDVGSVVNESTLTESKGFLTPSIITETSPGNYQWLYLFKGIERDLEQYKRVMKKLRVLAETKGWSDIDAITQFRHCRLSGSTNMKPGRKHHCSISVDIQQRYSLDELEAWLDKNLPKIKGKVRNNTPKIHDTTPQTDEIHDLLKAKDPLYRLDGEFIFFTCPWADSHTKQDKENRTAKYNLKDRFFKCFHSSCRERKQSEFIEAIEAKYKVKFTNPPKKKKGKKANRERFTALCAELGYQFMEGRFDGKAYVKVNGYQPRLIQGREGLAFQTDIVEALPMTDTTYRRLRSDMMTRHRYDPFREYLQSLTEPTEDGPSINTWASWLWDGIPDTPYFQLLQAWFFLQPAILNRWPGQIVRVVPTLLGPDTIGKSSAINNMMPPDIRKQTYLESLSLGLEGDNMVRAVRGKSLIHCSELVGLNKPHMTEAIKNFTTAQTLEIPSLKYMEEGMSYDRTYGLVASCNPGVTLPVDLALARRFGIIAIEPKPGWTQDAKTFMDKYRDRLWWEARERLDSIGPGDVVIPENLMADHHANVDAYRTETDPLRFKLWLDGTGKNELTSEDLRKELADWKSDNDCDRLSYQAITKIMKTSDPRWELIRRGKKRERVWIRKDASKIV